MDLFSIECKYCGWKWKINHHPSKYTTCTRCKDRDLIFKNIATDIIDYYAGTTPFESVEKKTKEIILEDPAISEKDDDIFNSYSYINGKWD